MKKSDDKEQYRQYRNKIVRESQRRRRMKAKEEGLCRQCIKNKALQGRTLCAECQRRQSKIQSDYMNRLRTLAESLGEDGKGC